MKSYIPGSIILHRPKTLFGKMVSFVTRSPISHVSICIGGNKAIESSFPKGVSTFNISNSKTIYAVLIPPVEFITEEFRIKLQNSVETIPNTSYDIYKTLSYIIPFLSNKKNLYNCVELCLYILRKSGFINKNIDADYPSDFQTCIPSWTLYEASNIKKNEEVS